MPTNSQAQNWRDEYPSLGYIAPFVLFLAFLALGPKLPLDPQIEGPVRVVTMALVCAVFWPREVSLRPVAPLLSVLVGTLVFFIWIAPDRLFSGYRDSFLFSNAIVGHTHSTLSDAALQNPGVLFWRTLRAVIIVPIVEELFWRGWLMRWLVSPDFRKIRLGTYTPMAFWITAILFASEHGPYWDVGLITGIIYNLWMIRSKSIVDCIIMHAVTNGILSAYVIYTAQWRYWQ